jgi:phenylalanyl-tRNA synthetase alpha chain
LVKGIDDIREMRSIYPQIAAQMINLEPYSQVSNNPSISGEMSIVTRRDTDLKDICKPTLQGLRNFCPSSDPFIASPYSPHRQ